MSTEIQTLILIFFDQRGGCCYVDRFSLTEDTSDYVTVMLCVCVGYIVT